MKVPKEIKVGSHTYAIRFNQDVTDAGEYGRVNHRTQLMELAPERPQSQRATSLIHELLHIVNNVYNNRRCQEDDIDALAEGLGQILKEQGIELDWGDIESA